jgi:pimeloyl-ACP methyl ester carboxylesterase
VTYALTHPTRVERLALVSAVVPGFGYEMSWVYRFVAT